ncbi:MAG TPA: hypothetical protein VNB49_04360, partial [Candidatus Dormibacteraeota bacterium]|nr:hypothetical protein [Candidatus Dormibacteraeota bacterium]
RNLAWTGDPVFPFLSARLSPDSVPTFAFANLLSDTGATSTLDPSQLIPFILIAAAQKTGVGFWDFFGPTVMALAPLAVLAFKNIRTWRIPISVWFISALGIFFVSGLPRYLLPVFPVALSVVAGGLEAGRHKAWTIVFWAGAALLVFMSFAGAAGLAMYSKKPALAATGLLERAEYLEQTAPDYQVIETVNRLLGKQGSQQKALVFMRHLYYLDIPYLNGDPATSFEMDAERLQTILEWKEFFEKNGIGYVVRSPEYPAAIAKPLAEMERLRDLVPFAQAEVQNFSGRRIDQNRVSLQVVILKVRR